MSQNPPLGYKKTHAFYLQNTNDDTRPDDGDDTVSWDITLNTPTQFKNEMVPFILKESQKMLDESTERSQKLLKIRR